MPSNTVSYPCYPNSAISISATLNLPEGFEKSKKYGAIICAHPFGSCKEQVAGQYGAKLAELGYVTLVPDATYQGESGGEPKGMEYAPQRVEDICCAVDYLVTQDFVDENRIGVLGMCAGGGYASSATMMDRRIKALATISAINLGRSHRAGEFDPSQNPIKELESICAQRTAEARGEDFMICPLLPADRETLKQRGCDTGDMADAFDYYNTPRGQHPRSNFKFVYRSWQSLFLFDAFHFAESLLTQPLLVIVGTKVGEFGAYRDGYELYGKARSEHKSLHEVQGASHIDLYDQPKPVAEVIAKLSEFYEKYL
uniref:ARAD1C00572p n=1 Tax=Blastobotrys adeninivorans TaxID=409370 RepID=A0A060SYW6_BLAAD